MGTPGASEQQRDWRCRMGRHSFVGVIDDDPDAGRTRYYRCSRCGAWHEPTTEPEVDIEKLKRTNYFSGW